MAKSDRPRAAPARGILERAAPDGTIEHDRVLPLSPRVAEVVAHFWSIRWQLRTPFVAATLPHPTTHIVFSHRDAPTIAGPSSKRFERVLADEGWVFGVKFRPGMVEACAHLPPVSALANRVTPLPRARTWSVELRRATSVEARATICEERLERLIQGVDEDQRLVRDLTERLERDRSLLRVEQLAAEAQLSVRALERRFRRCLGQSPKRVVMRYRLIDAAETLAAAPALTIAEVALQLGYFDQAHFVRDFRSLIGEAPSAYRLRRAPRG